MWGEGSVEPGANGFRELRHAGPDEREQKVVDGHRRGVVPLNEFDQGAQRRRVVQVELIQKEIIGVDDLEVERLNRVRRKSFKLNVTSTSAPPRTAAASTCRSFSSFRHRRNEIVVARHHRVSKVVLHRGDALFYEVRILAVRDQVLREFGHHILRPERPEQTAISEFENEVVDQRPVQDIRVEERRKAHSASSSFNRFTLFGSPIRIFAVGLVRCSSRRAA